jgi:hypothetical protein
MRTRASLHRSTLPAAGGVAAVPRPWGPRENGDATQHRRAARPIGMAWNVRHTAAHRVRRTGRADVSRPRSTPCTCAPPDDALGPHWPSRSS